MDYDTNNPKSEPNQAPPPWAGVSSKHYAYVCGANVVPFRAICDRLAKHGIEVIGQALSSRVFNPPKKTTLILVVVDQVSHELSSKAYSYSKSVGVPVINGPYRPWPTTIQRLTERGFIRSGGDVATLAELIGPAKTAALELQVKSKEGAACGRCAQIILDGQEHTCPEGTPEPKPHPTPSVQEHVGHKSNPVERCIHGMQKHTCRVCVQKEAPPPPPPPTPPEPEPLVCYEHPDAAEHERADELCDILFPIDVQQEPPPQKSEWQQGVEEVLEQTRVWDSITKAPPEENVEKPMTEEAAVLSILKEHEGNITHADVLRAMTKKGYKKWGPRDTNKYRVISRIRTAHGYPEKPKNAGTKYTSKRGTLAGLVKEAVLKKAPDYPPTVSLDKDFQSTLNSLGELVKDAMGKFRLKHLSIKGNPVVSAEDGKTTMVISIDYEQLTVVTGSIKL